MLRKNFRFQSGVAVESHRMTLIVHPPVAPSSATKSRPRSFLELAQEWLICQLIRIIQAAS
jgi:hypothetical protein